MAIGLWGLLIGLQSLDSWALELARFTPDRMPNRDWAIVFLSARFSIVMIPVVAIWFFTSKVARLLVSLMVMVSAIGLFSAVQRWLEAGGIEWETLFLILSSWVAVALLYLPAAHHWFAGEKSTDSMVFE